MRIWVDGATRQTCYVIEDEEPVVTPVSPPVTNNMGEYLALIHGLQAALNKGVKELDVYADSELMVNQLNCNPDGRPIYRCLSEGLDALRVEALDLIRKFDNLSLRWIPRDKNLAGVHLERMG